uniref:USP domain-containing protein n=1 Tax=Falco tinnunculus TaxID=100819 RepID=A0A8C4UAS1_FALTI
SVGLLDFQQSKQVNRLFSKMLSSPVNSSGSVELPAMFLAWGLELVVLGAPAYNSIFQICFCATVLSQLFSNIISLQRRPGAGLYNPGTTCFVNAVLQCLTYTPPLANYLLSREHSSSCRQQGFCMMCIMEAHVNNVLHTSASAIMPTAIINALPQIGDYFKLGMPGDAYAFLHCTVTAMHRACTSGHSE